MWRFVARTSLVLGLSMLGVTSASAQLIFNFTNSSTNPPTAQMITGFAQAGVLWSSIFNDNITINVTIGSSNLGANVIGSTGNALTNVSYTNTRDALIADGISTDDIATSSLLQTTTGVSMLINRTLNNPNGANSSAPYFDTGLGGAGQAGTQNNTTIRMPRSNAKALGLISGTSTNNDGNITFNSNFAFDYDRSNGITASQIDFVGVAAHEIGHLLGFVSGVDTLDVNNTGRNDNQYVNVSVLDLFRFSTRSINVANGGGVGVIDWTADNTSKYFSVDGGVTNLALYSNGTTLGDGRQASHWKDNLGIGIMDPTASSGELLTITNLDIRALDVIGFDRIVAVPEPATILLVGFIGIAGWQVGKRYRKLTQRAMDQVVDLST